MDREFFVNGGAPLPLHLLDPSSPMPTWELNCSLDHFFLNPNWDKYAHFDSPMLSSPPTSNDTLPIIAASTSNSNLSNMDHFVNDDLPNMPLSNPNFVAVSADSRFRDRAAKFSGFGSQSFNSGMSQSEWKSSEFSYGGRPSPLMGGAKLPKVASSPSFQSSMGVKNNKNVSQNQIQMRFDNNFTKISASNKDSSVSEHNPSGETGLTTPIDSNSRKRKMVSRGKSKDIAQSLLPIANATKVAEMEDDLNSKRSKMADCNATGGVKSEERNDSAGGNEKQKQAKESPKPTEPPKDYIHVRARRGQATDSHSLAERVRREKISERMKLLQDLVPGCDKVTGKTLMLEEIIKYVQSLQSQVEFLSMKLASVDLQMDTDMDSLLPKDIFPPNGSSTQPIYPLGNPQQLFCGHQHPQQSRPQGHISASNVAVAQCSVDPLNTTLRRNIAMQLSSVDEFGQSLPQVPAFSEAGLQNIFEMGFGQDQSDDRAFHSQSFPGPNQTSHEN